jgi:hypothetical protein
MGEAQVLLGQDRRMSVEPSAGAREPRIRRAPGARG